MLSTSRLARLDAKYDHIKNALGVKRSSTISDEDVSSEKLKRRKRIGQRISSSVKLFGGSIEEYLELNKVDIPLIMKSCIRVVNLFGLHHQGIFRVSGSQVEINNFKDSFERGEDPLCELTDASDINSVASLLKLYLRELREPLFPIVFFDFFMEVARE
jgi:SLIT-ROBO Rho GTPase activating protein